MESYIHSLQSFFVASLRREKRESVREQNIMNVGELRLTVQQTGSINVVLC